MIFAEKMLTSHFEGARHSAPREMMRGLLLTIAAVVAMTFACSAQRLRIGEKLPSIDVDSSVGSDLKQIEKEYACIIFMHSESEPSIEAIKSFTTLSTAYNERLAMVLITPEQDGYEQEVLSSFTTIDTIVAFDNNYRTFESFKVRHLPFAVLYETRSRRVQWFGSLTQLSEEQLEKILKQKKE